MAEISIGDEADEETAKRVSDGLTRFNDAHVGAEQARPLFAACRDEGGEVVGGLQGYTLWRWLVVSILWVREEDRGKGIGSRLLAAGEAAARERGCDRAQLTTMTFQAPAFYERRGYREIGRVEDFPEGHACVWLTKPLSA